MDKKAQLSFETIIIYGLIIVVVTLAVGALVYFGVLDLGRLLPEKCNTGAPTVCESYQIVAGTAGSDHIKIEVRNKVGKRINFQTGTIIRGADDWIGSDCNLTKVNNNDTKGTGDDANLFTKVIGIDETALLAFDCGAALPSTVITQRYKGTITLEYRAIGSQLAQRTTGQIFAAIS